jgi:aspartate kinase
VSIVVQKYGGTSVGDVDRMKRVADRVARSHRGGNQTVVVVSAMGKTTDDLVSMAARISERPPERELDILLTAGERISMSLLAMALAERGVPAKSFTGSQAGIITDAVHGKARIVDITPGRVKEALDDGNVVIVAGFQGVSQDTKDITTLGRGGSDTTAVALAAALGADVCEIYTDVDGVFTADPRIAPKARKVPTITYEEMLELAANGAKVLHLRCVEYARRFDLPIHVRSSFSPQEGTFVVSDAARSAADTEGDAVEQPIIAGVAHDLGDAKVTVVGVPDRPGEAAAIFRAVADAEVNIDMIVQNVSGTSGLTDVTFTCPMADGTRALAALEAVKGEIGFEDLRYDDGIAKISLVGAGMRSHPGVSATFFAALSDAGINVEMISTSEIRISVVTRAESAGTAVSAVHTAFGLDADGEAVVYAGTGR